MRRELEEELEEELHCVGETMKHKGVEIFHKLQLKLFRSWSDFIGEGESSGSGSGSGSSHGDRARSDSPSTPVAAAAPVVTGASDGERTALEPVAAAAIAVPPNSLDGALGHQQPPQPSEFEYPNYLDIPPPEDYIFETLQGPGEELLEDLLQPREQWSADAFSTPGLGFDVGFTALSS